jgi:hypothetical protein
MSSAVARRIAARGKATRVECLHDELEQLRICDKELEKQTAQPIRFHEAYELIQSCIRVGSFRQPIQQRRLQLVKDPPRPRRDVET